MRQSITMIPVRFGLTIRSLFCAFPPSFLARSLARRASAAAAITNPTTNPRVLSLAKLAVDNLPTIMHLGQRKQVPSTVELQCLMESKPIPIKVSLVNGSFKTLSIDPYILISEVEKMMHERFSITFRVPFALYEQAEVNEERLLDPTERMLDVIAGWENKPLVEEIKVEKKAEKAKIYEKVRRTRERGRASGLAGVCVCAISLRSVSICLFGFVLPLSSARSSSSLSRPRPTPRRRWRRW